MVARPEHVYWALGSFLACRSVQTEAVLNLEEEIFLGANVKFLTHGLPFLLISVLEMARCVEELETNSMEDLCSDTFLSSILCRASCWTWRSSSLNAQGGRVEVFQSSTGKDVLYCDCSSIPACCIILINKLGFFNDDELASFALKWTPCFLRERKCSNLALAAGSGDPGGDGGMSKSGIGGSVKSWIKARDVEKGEVRPPAERSSGYGVVFIDAGPSTGPFGTSLMVPNSSWLGASTAAF